MDSRFCDIIEKKKLMIMEKMKKKKREEGEKGQESKQKIEGRRMLLGS